MEINRDDLVEKLKDKWGNCPMCGVKDFLTGERLMELRECEGGGMSSNSFVHPIVTITCKNCGHLMLVDATTINLKMNNK